MPEFLLLRFEGPMQSWGREAIDPSRPTGAFPRTSAIAGLLANALGWEHRDAQRTTTLQDRLRYAVREDRPPSRMWDFQTADLSTQSGWGRWGPTDPGGGSSDGTHIQRKEYLADASFLVALGLEDAAAPTLDELEAALRAPARPLFLGRKSCPPSGPIFRKRVTAESLFQALATQLIAQVDTPDDVRFWVDRRADEGWANSTTLEVWDRRDYETSRFGQARDVVSFRKSVLEES